MVGPTRSVASRSPSTAAPGVGVSYSVLPTLFPAFSRLVSADEASSTEQELDGPLYIAINTLLGLLGALNLHRQFLKTKAQRLANGLAERWDAVCAIGV